MTPPLKVPYVRKHVHRWVLAEKKPAVQGGWVYGWLGDQTHIDAKPMRMIRECDDCGLKQVCDVDDESKLVTGYEAVCDFDWKAVK